MIDRENILPSDSLEIAIDLEEHLHSPCKPYWEMYRARISLSINTSYPEVNGGYYCNWRVIAALNEAIEDAGLAIVSPEYVAESTILPVEHLLGIDFQEPYLLFDSKQATVGAIFKWQYFAGGGGPFFGESLIIDIFCERAAQRRLVESIVSYCKMRRIAWKYFTGQA